MIVVANNLTLFVLMWFLIIFFFVQFISYLIADLINDRS